MLFIIKVYGGINAFEDVVDQFFDFNRFYDGKKNLSL
jgi:hypothetical protein